MTMREKLDLLEGRIAESEQGGGAARVKAQHAKGKLSARERLDLLQDEGSFVEEAQSRAKREVKLPEGYFLTWGGEFENQRRAMKRLEIIVPVSIVVIFFLLYLTFRAVLPAVVVLLDVPFATVGGVWLGCLAAVRRNTFIDTGAMLAALCAISVPTFVIGLREGVEAAREAVDSGAAARTTDAYLELSRRLATG